VIAIVIILAIIWTPVAYLISEATLAVFVSYIESRQLDTVLREHKALREASQRRYITEQGAYR
jgi:hypothetical protein